jgi:hypothetical protein
MPRRRTGQGRAPTIREAAEAAGVTLGMVGRVAGRHADLHKALRSRRSPLTEWLPRGSCAPSR